LTGVLGNGLLSEETPVVSQAISSVSAAGAVGTIGIGVRTVPLTGVRANGTAGSLNVRYWSLIDDNQNANWQNINTE
jgi:hypothetical protein